MPAYAVRELAEVDLGGVVRSTSGGTSRASRMSDADRGGRAIVIVDGNSVYCSCERVFDKFEMRSPRYTTQVSELPTARAS